MGLNSDIVQVIEQIDKIITSQDLAGGSMCLILPSNRVKIVTI